MDPVRGDDRSWSEKIQTSPACFFCLFQAVSVLHVMIVCGVLEFDGWFLIDGEICEFFAHFTVGSCAKFHSFANFKPLVAISTRV